MADEISRRVSASIDQKLRVLSPTPSERCIFKMTSHLAKHNEMYEPEVIAIGPYHRGKEHLQAMEETKLSYLKQLLRRRQEDTVNNYVVAMTALRERACKYYTESPNLSEEEFIEMMVVDGCFIVELIRKFKNTNIGDGDDRVFRHSSTLRRLKYDLFLLDNQLPLFVIWEVFTMTKPPHQEEHFARWIWEFFHHVLPGFSKLEDHESSIGNAKHLVEFVYQSWIPPNLLYYSKPRGHQGVLIPSTSELAASGIMFGKGDHSCLFDIKFLYGRLSIPLLLIDEKTEFTFTSLIAYEQFCDDGAPRYVTDYTAFMCMLIKSPKDVKFLQRSGVIQNYLGSERAAAIFDRLGTNVVHLFEDDSIYSEVREKVHKFCSRRWTMWRARLMQDYFVDPMAFLTIVTTIILQTEFGFLQTLFSILGYYKGKD